MLSSERNSRRISGAVAIAVLLVGLATDFGPATTSAAASVPPCPGAIGMQPPAPGASGSELTGVAVRSAADVWAVGSAASDGPSQALIERWNGSAWKIVPSPSPGESAGLASVRALSANNAWAVGSFSTSGSTARRTLIEHWTGSSWTVVPSPNPGMSQILAGVRFVSANDGWAVGSFTPTAGAGIRGMILRWNGTRWALVRSAEPGSDVMLMGIAATAHDNAWAVGMFSDGTESSTLIEHWDGTRWARVASPDLGSANDSFLASVAASARRSWPRPTASARTAWAVGLFTDPGAGHALAVHCG